jgi:cytidylate kinase
MGYLWDKEVIMPTNHLKTVQQFLKERKSPAEIPVSGFPFVTIARQTGAGSHLLCDMLLEDFRKESSDLFRGWHVFDRLICEAVAQDPDLNRSLEDLVKEHYENEFQDLMDSLIAGTTGRYQLYKKTFQVITMLAAIGKVIIVGRAACCVTESFKAGIHIRLVAPEAERIAATMKRLRVSREEARKIMKTKESERQRLMKSFFDHDLSNPLLYDATWNTGKVDMSEISASIIHLIKSRAAMKDE